MLHLTEYEKDLEYTIQVKRNVEIWIQDIEFAAFLFIKFFLDIVQYLKLLVRLKKV